MLNGSHLKPSLCLGAVTCDISITGLAAFPEPETEFSPRSDIFHQRPARLIPAGTAGNSALACAALAGKARLLGPVGDDLLGRTIRTAFAEGGVELAGCGATTTSTHVIANSTDGRRQAFYYPGESIRLQQTPPDWAATNLLFSGLNLCVERPITPGVIELADIAHSVGAIVALDVGQAGADMLTFGELAQLEGAIDILIGSHYEWGLVLGQRPETRIHRLRAITPGHVVVKLGRQGARLYCPGHRDPVNIGAARVTDRNPIGAGDAFAGGMLAAIAAGMELPEACRWGSAAAAAAVESEGGPGSISFERVQRLHAEICLN